jgi:uncharacterized protein (UPF0332 family)
MKEFLKIYRQSGRLKEEKIGFDQVIKHIERAKQDIKVAAANLTIDAEASYNYAYLAMLRSGRALMFSFGYRPLDGEQHKTVVAFCEQALDKKFIELVKHFDRMRKKRNRFTYDEPGLLVTDTETANAFKHAEEFVRQVSGFIRERNPQQKLL